MFPSSKISSASERDDCKVENSCTEENCPDSLTMDKVIETIGSSAIYPWRCPEKHILGSKCCKEYIQSQYPRWEHHYFAYVSVLGTPEDSILSSKEWKFKFELTFEYRSKYYAFPFRTSYEILKDLEKKIDVEEAKQKLFPCKEYPDPYNKKLIPPTLSEEMKEDAKVLCRKPLPWLLSFRVGSKQVEAIRKYLQHLFSSPALLLKQWFYEDLLESDMRFFEPVKKLLMSRAEKQVSNWKGSSSRISMKLDKLRRQKTRDDEDFHTVYAMRRLLVGSRLLYHWALAFEGPKHLLRIEYFDNSEIEWLLVPNATHKRRAFWFDTNENFTERWLILSTFRAARKNKYLKASQIGSWLEGWHQRHSEYSGLSNNCQHFVRDIVAHIHTNDALGLNGLMDVQSGSSLIPGMLVSHNVSQFTRTFDEWNASQKRDKNDPQKDTIDVTVSKPAPTLTAEMQAGEQKSSNEDTPQNEGIPNEKITTPGNLANEPNSQIPQDDAKTVVTHMLPKEG